MSPILVALTSRNDSDFESWNVSLKENKPNGVNPNSNDVDYYVRKNEGKVLWFSADCICSQYVSFQLNHKRRILALIKVLDSYTGRSTGIVFPTR